jgi:hypothetical protein
MSADDIVKQLQDARLPVYVVAEPPISTGHATTEELLREQDVLRWRRAEAEWTHGPDSQEAKITGYLVEEELFAIERELGRRRQVKDMPSAPRWPAAPEDKRAEWYEIKRRTDIVDLAFKVVGANAVQQGGLVWFSCFAHEDNTPSLAVYPSDQHFHCFSCGLHGDVIDLARHALHLTSFQATMAVLGEWCGVTSRTIAIETPEGTKEVTPG